MRECFISGHLGLPDNETLTSLFIFLIHLSSEHSICSNPTASSCEHPLLWPDESHKEDEHDSTSNFSCIIMATILSWK